MTGILALKRLQPSGLKYVGGTIDYGGDAALEEWKHALAFATGLLRFEAKREGDYTHLVAIQEDGVDEPVSVLLRFE